jgi:hypothetical protein
MIKKVDCSCGGVFDYETAAGLVYRESIDGLLKKAKERLNQIISNHCMLCGTKQQGSDNIVKQPKIVITDGGDVKKEHAVCKPCITRYKNEFSKNQNVQLKCFICGTNHSCDMRILRQVVKNNDAACCLII